MRFGPWCEVLSWFSPAAKFAIESIQQAKTKKDVCLNYKSLVGKKILSNGIRNKIFRNKVMEFQTVSDRNLLNEYLLHLKKGYLDYAL